jgi:nucleoside 2-deoxyribosyltransferase
MKSTRPRIYLAGKVPKGAEIGTAEDWRSRYIQKLSEFGEFEFLSPEDPTLDERYPRQIFGHDCYLVRECDILIINAGSKLGAGTAQEMVIAKYFQKYVLTVLPRDSHHRRSNLDMHGILVEDWIHPFVHETSDGIAAELDELGRWLLHGCAGLYRNPPKNLKVVDEAIGAYLDSGHGGAAHDHALGSGADRIR